MAMAARGKDLKLQTLRITEAANRASEAATDAGIAIRRCGRVPVEFQRAVSSFNATVQALGPAMLSLLIVFIVHQVRLPIHAPIGTNSPLTP